MENIFLKPGQIFRVVHNHEPLQPHFLIREKFEHPYAYGCWDTTFKGDSWLGTAWHTVEDELPTWIGESIDNLNGKLLYSSAASGWFNYEVIEIIDL